MIHWNVGNIFECNPQGYLIDTNYWLFIWDQTKENKWFQFVEMIRTVNLILAFWYPNSCRIVCVIAVSAYFDAGYTLNNGTGKSGMRCPRTLEKNQMKNDHWALDWKKFRLKSMEKILKSLFPRYRLDGSKMIYLKS